MLLRQQIINKLVRKCFVVSEKANTGCVLGDIISDTSTAINKNKILYNHSLANVL